MMKTLRRAWLVRLKNKDLYCALCGCLIKTRKELNADHYYLPRSKGGATNEYNLQPAHKWCNESRGNVDLIDWQLNGYRYLKELVGRWKRNHTRYNQSGVNASLKSLKKTCKER